MAGAVAPLASMTAYGYLIDQPNTQGPLFDRLTAVVPLWGWGLAWTSVALLALDSALNGRRATGQLAVTLGWMVSTYTLVSVLWAKQVDGIRLSWVGVSWAFGLFAGFGVAAMWRWLEQRDIPS